MVRRVLDDKGRKAVVPGKEGGRGERARGRNWSPYRDGLGSFLCFDVPGVRAGQRIPGSRELQNTGVAVSQLWCRVTACWLFTAAVDCVGEEVKR